jgi:hypothetical protein
VFKSNPFTNVQPQYNFVWTAALPGVDCLIYEIDTTAFEDIGNEFCLNQVNQVCIKFRKNLQWMTMIPTSPLTANINSQINALEIFTPGFEGTFKFRVRAMKGGRVLNKH